MKILFHSDLASADRNCCILHILKLKNRTHFHHKKDVMVGCGGVDGGGAVDVDDSGGSCVAAGVMVRVRYLTIKGIGAKI